ncbi:hypothetical protein LCGC14_0736780 [marine sediment metagenome]|uniref:Transposase n=1 Tax=marine sediment metagenome TaxID=412755 RepID=A0A0F9QC43_9ZZZZ
MPHQRKTDYQFDLFSSPVTATTVEIPPWQSLPAETKRKRYSEEQIIGVLKEQEAGAKGADLARKHGVSEATLYNWKAKFGGMDVSDARRLRALEDENAKLKKLLAEQMLDAAALRELLAKNGRARRRARSRCAPAGRDGPVRAAGLSVRRCQPQDGSLSIAQTAGHRASRQAETSPTSAVASATGGCSSCSGATASHRGSTGFIASIARKG